MVVSLGSMPIMDLSSTYASETRFKYLFYMCLLGSEKIWKPNFIPTLFKAPQGWKIAFKPVASGRCFLRNCTSSYLQLLHAYTYLHVGLKGAWLVSRRTLVRSASALLSLLFKKCGLWTLSFDFAHTVNETLKWLTQLPTLMQNHTGGDSVARC